jgi:hypothetical protein
MRYHALHLSAPYNDAVDDIDWPDHNSPCDDDDCTRDHFHVYTDEQQRASDEHLVRTAIECVHDVGLHEFYDHGVIIDAASRR